MLKFYDRAARNSLNIYLTQMISIVLLSCFELFCIGQSGEITKLCQFNWSPESKVQFLECCTSDGMCHLIASIEGFDDDDDDGDADSINDDYNDEDNDNDDDDKDDDDDDNNVNNNYC